MTTTLNPPEIKKNEKHHSYETQVLWRLKRSGQLRFGVHRTQSLTAYHADCHDRADLLAVRTYHQTTPVPQFFLLSICMSTMKTTGPFTDLYKEYRRQVDAERKAKRAAEKAA